MEDRISEVLGSISLAATNKKINKIMDCIYLIIETVSCMDYNDWEEFCDEEYDEFVDELVKDMEKIINEG